jgi:DNA polymerase (family 10)
MPGNQEIAHLLDEMADLLEIQGENRFKIRAYRMAAGKLSEMALPKDLARKSKKKFYKGSLI